MKEGKIVSSAEYERIMLMRVNSGSLKMSSAKEMMLDSRIKIVSFQNRGYPSERSSVPWWSGIRLCESSHPCAFPEAHKLSGADLQTR